MRLLFLSPFVPFPPHDGGRLRVYELVKRLATRHHVDVLTFADGSDSEVQAVSQLRQQGLTVDPVSSPRSMPSAARRALLQRRSVYGMRFDSREFASALSSRLATQRYDVVQCEFAYMGQYAERKAREASRGARWVLDAHNVDYRLYQQFSERSPAKRGFGYRLYARREAVRRRGEEIAIWRNVDHVLTVSQIESRYLNDVVPEVPVTVVPNGIDPDVFSFASSAPTEPHGAVFVGKMDYRPNAEAVRWFSERVLPLVRRAQPDFGLTVVGASPSPEVSALSQLAGVRVTGEVPDTRPYLCDAAVVVVPLLAGAGTRIKILEALASGRPVVSTSIGCEGLEVVDEEHLLMADEPEAFARQITRLLQDRSLYSSLAQRGRAIVERRYAWPVILDSLEALYERLLAGDRTETAGMAWPR